MSLTFLNPIDCHRPQIELLPPKHGSLCSGAFSLNYKLSTFKLWLQKVAQLWLCFLKTVQKCLKHFISNLSRSLAGSPTNLRADPGRFRLVQLQLCHPGPCRWSGLTQHTSACFSHILQGIHTAQWSAPPVTTRAMHAIPLVEAASECFSSFGWLPSWLSTFLNFYTFPTWTVSSIKIIQAHRPGQRRASPSPA